MSFKNFFIILKNILKNKIFVCCRMKVSLTDIDGDGNIDEIKVDYENSEGEFFCAEV